MSKQPGTVTMLFQYFTQGIVCGLRQLDIIEAGLREATQDVRHRNKRRNGYSSGLGIRARAGGRERASETRGGAVMTCTFFGRRDGFSGHTCTAPILCGQGVEQV